jgi:tripartite-type tricarboxylate transporter receptor subunit TctC
MRQGLGRRSLLAVGAMLGLPGRAIGQETGAQPEGWPARPVRIVVPFTPGGSNDAIARPLAERLQPRLGQQVVIENRGGANGSIGMEATVRAPADGYTIVIATVGTWSVNPFLYKLPYDVVTDLAPLVHIATTPGVLAVHPSVPVRSVKDLLALARQRPADLNYGSAGIGGFGHMSAELFSLTARVKFTHVPYKGSAPALVDLLGGHIQVLFNSALPTMPHIRTGRVRALATTGARRLEILAELPTVAEAGVAGFENSTWSALGAPARTPRAIIERLNKEINAVLQQPEVREAARHEGSAITGGTPEQFGEYLKAELAKFGKLVKAAGIKADGGS